MLEKEMVEKRVEIELFNPRHDKLGRFAPRRGGGFGSREKVAIGAAIAAGGLARGAVRYGPDAKARIKETSDRASSRVPDGYKNPDANIKMHTSTTRHIIAGRGIPQIGASLGFVTKAGSKDANISGTATKWAAKDAKKKKDRQKKIIAESVIAHELIHTRKRSRDRRYNPPIEEGLTELLLESKTGYPSGDAYRQYSDSMANIAMKVSGGDRQKALKWVDDAHRKSYDYNDISKQLARSGIDVSPRDLSYYAGGKPFFRKAGGYSALGDQRGASKALTGDFVKYGARGYSNFDATAYASIAVESLGWSALVMGGLGLAGEAVFADPENPEFVLPDIIQHLPFKNIPKVISEAKKLAAKDGHDPEGVETQFAYASDFVAMLSPKEKAKMK
jgi:hypothetical protein